MRPSESGAAGGGAFGVGFAMAGAEGGEAEVGRGAATGGGRRGIDATMGGFAVVAEDGREAGDDEICGFGPAREAEGGDHVGEEGFDLGGGNEGIERVTEGDAVSAGEGVDHADGAEVIAFGELVGGEGAVVEEPHAEFEWIEFRREGAEVECEERLRELAFEVVEMDFELAGFFESEAVGGVGDAFEADPFGAEVGGEVGVAESAAFAEGLLRGDGMGAVRTPHVVNLP